MDKENKQVSPAEQRAQASSGPQNMQANKPSNEFQWGKNGMIVAVIALLLASAIAAGFYFFTNQGEKETVQPEEQKQAVVEQKVEQQDGVKWLDYKNTDYFFGFKYPADFVFDQNFLADESIVYSVNCGKKLDAPQGNRKSARGFAVVVRKKTGELQEYLDVYNQGEVDKGRKVQELIGREVPPYDAKLMQSCMGKEYCDFSYFFADNMFIFEVKHTSSEDVEEARIYDAMADSFYYFFSNANNNELYKNKAYGYLIDYPQTWKVRDNEKKGDFNGYVRNTTFTSPDGSYTLLFGLRIEDETPIKLSEKKDSKFEKMDFAEPIKIGAEQVVPDYYGSKESGALKEFVVWDHRTSIFMMHVEFMINDDSMAGDFKDSLEFEQAKQILASFRFTEEKLK